jgi:hypothetical protein
MLSDNFYIYIYIEEGACAFERSTGRRKILGDGNEYMYDINIIRPSQKQRIYLFIHIFILLICINKKKKKNSEKERKVKMGAWKRAHIF